MKRILFVCVGNICRSPMAEALCRHRLAQHPKLGAIKVASAGVAALDGDLPSPHAVQIMRTLYNLDISNHQARRLLGDRDADLILTMDAYTTRRATELGLKGQVEMLGVFAGDGESIDDPYGDGNDVYCECAQKLDRLIEAALERLEREWTSEDK